MVKKDNVTDSIISRAGLTRGEAKVVRCYYRLQSAGSENSRTMRWVRRLDSHKYGLLLRSGREKIEQTLSQGAGN